MSAIVTLQLHTVADCTEFHETHGNSLILGGLAIAFISTADRFNHKLCVFARMAMCLWVSEHVCRLQLATPTHWHKQRGNRAGTEQIGGRRMPGRQGLWKTDCQLAPAIWLPQWVQKACPELDLLWKFKFYSPIFPKAIRDFTVSGSVQFSPENVTIEHIFQTSVCQIFVNAWTKLEGFMPLGKAHKKVWC